MRFYIIKTQPGVSCPVPDKNRDKVQKNFGERNYALNHFTDHTGSLSHVTLKNASDMFGNEFIFLRLGLT